jgi:hypothetical protein
MIRMPVMLGLTVVSPPRLSIAALGPQSDTSVAASRGIMRADNWRCQDASAQQL